jgi:hypothetical protein
MKLLPETIEPRGEKISRAAAKVFLRQYLLKTKGLQKEDVALLVERFADEMMFESENLQAEVVDAMESSREDLRDLKERLGQMRKMLKEETNSEKREKLLWDIEMLVDEIADAKEYGKDSIQEARTARAAFVEDERVYLCQYINRLV